MNGGHSSLRCTGFSLRGFLLRSTDFRCTGSVVVACGFYSAGSVVLAHGLSCSAACGIFPDQGSSPCPLHWQADSQPLRHQGSPLLYFYLLKISMHLVNCKLQPVPSVERGNILFYAAALLEQKHMDASKVKLGYIYFFPSSVSNKCLFFFRLTGRKL